MLEGPFSSPAGSIATCCLVLVPPRRGVALAPQGPIRTVSKDICSKTVPGEKAVLQDAAGRAVVDLLRHELRQPASFFRALSNLVPVRLYHLVEHRLFRTVALAA